MTTTPSIADIFAGFDTYEPSLAKAQALCRSFCEQATAPELPRAEAHNPFQAAIQSLSGSQAMRSLTLSGRNGTGKSWLAGRTYEHVRRNYPFATGPRIAGHGILRSRRPEVVFIRETELAQRCMNGDHGLPEYLADDWLVILDDLGASRDKTGFVSDLLFRLFDARREALTLTTTNLTLKEIGEQIGHRVASRLIRDGNVFHRIEASDYALRDRK